MAQAVQRDGAAAGQTLRLDIQDTRFEPVSYTHLTLPTIYSV